MVCFGSKTPPDRPVWNRSSLELGAELHVVGGVIRDWLKHVSFSNVASDHEKDETKKMN